MLAVLRVRNFALLWGAGAVSLLGDWVLLIALPFYVYNRTGSALATGAMFMAQTVPRILLGSVAGVFVDRWDRQRTMVVADLSRAALLLLLLLARSPDWLWIVYPVAALQAAIGQFFLPAQSATVPRLVDEEQLVAANALTSLSMNLTRLVGPALGGALLGLVGLPAVVLLDAASFLISGLLLALIAVPPTAGAADGAGVTPVPPAAAGWATVWREWREGLRLVGRDRLLSALFVVFSTVMIAEGLFAVLLVPFVKEVLGGDAPQLGWLMSAQAVGGLAGGLLIGRLGGRVAPVRLIALSGVLDGLLLLAIVNLRSYAAGLVLIALAGIPVTAFFVGTQSLLMGGVADQYRGRVFGALGTTTAVMTLVGMGLARALGDRAGIVPTLSGAGALYALAGALALVLLPGAGAEGRAVAGEEPTLVPSSHSGQALGEAQEVRGREATV